MLVLILTVIHIYPSRIPISMRKSILKGTTFGLTSGIITTLGLIVGLNSGTHSKLVVLGGILTIAIADAFSDALGIHISEESENTHTTKEIWAATLCTFASKFLFALQFVIPIMVFSLNTAIIASVVWGLFLIALLSYLIAKMQKVNPLKVIGEHVFITCIVIAATHYVGLFIASFIA